MKVNPIVGTGISGITLELSLAELIVLKSVLPGNEPCITKENYHERQQYEKRKQEFTGKIEVFIKKITNDITGLCDAESQLFVEAPLKPLLQVEE